MTASYPNMKTEYYRKWMDEVTIDGLNQTREQFLLHYIKNNKLDDDVLKTTIYLIWKEAWDAREPQVQSMIDHARGRTAKEDTATLLRFLADRLVSVYEESRYTDYIQAAHERADMLDKITNGEIF